MKYSYGKKEKLKSRKQIEKLFSEGISVASYPLRMVFIASDHDSDFPFKVGVSVSKKKVAKAVSRNKIKRLLREVYRLNKHELAKDLDAKYIAMLIFVDSKPWELDALQHKMKKITTKFHQKIKE